MHNSQDNGAAVEQNVAPAEGSARPNLGSYFGQTENRTVGSVEETATRSGGEEPTQRLATGAGIDLAGRTANESIVSPGAPSDLAPADSQIVTSSPDSLTAAVSESIPPGSAVSSADASAEPSPATSTETLALEPGEEPPVRPAVGPPLGRVVEPAVRPDNVVLPPVAFDWEQPNVPHNVPAWLPYGDAGPQDPPNSFCSWCNDLLADEKVFACLTCIMILILISVLAYVVHAIF